MNLKHGRCDSESSSSCRPGVTLLLLSYASRHIAACLNVGCASGTPVRNTIKYLPLIVPDKVLQDDVLARNAINRKLTKKRKTSHCVYLTA